MISDRRKIRIGAWGISFLFAGIFGFYGYAFYFGGYSRWNQFTDRNGDVVTAGTIMICIFCIIMSSMTLAGIAPNITPIIEGCVAGTLATECIEKQPKI